MKEQIQIIYFTSCFICAVIYFIGYIVYVAKGHAKEDDSIIIFLSLTGGPIAVFFISMMAIPFILFFILPAFIIHLIRRKPLSEFLS